MVVQRIKPMDMFKSAWASRRSKSPHGLRSGSGQIATPPGHPVSNLEGKVCPITGQIAFAAEGEHVLSTPAGAHADLKELQSDPDIAEEMHASIQDQDTIEIPAAISSEHFVPLNVVNGKHMANSETRRLVRNVGLPALRRFTTVFYRRCFADPHVDKFIHSHDDPHGERFATWIVEKFGDGTPWTDERATRKKRFMKFGHESVQVAHDRSSAHFAAWHSPKREAHKWGEHFKPDDARVWMRLHFWAARECGMFQHQAFMEYYIRFIAHFISVYSSKSPPFTRESVRWSADQSNTERYLANGHVMTDVIGKPVEQALRELPAEEQLYTGSRARNPSWPYENSPEV